MTADPVGGVWTYALELIRSWERYPVQVALATMGAPLSPAQRAEVAALPQVVLHESTFKLEWMEQPWDDVDAAGTWLLRLRDAFRPDLIHLNNFCQGHLPWGTPVVMVVHSCVLSWWQGVKGQPAPAEWDAYRRRVGQGLQAADLVVAPSLAMLQQAQDLYGPFRRSQVIYNGRQSQWFGYQVKEPFILGMGRIWDEAKNLHLLAQLAPRLPWPVYLAGEARHPVTGQQQQWPNVHLLGHLGPPELRDLLARAAIFVLPARYEPFGLSALEAALSGCALVLSPLPSLQEIWGQAATYADPREPDALIRVLESLCQDEFRRNIMGFRAIRQGLQYSARQMAHEYLQAYQHLAPAAGHYFPKPAFLIS
jgi:glycosyltransferase involved in cell wall biosynthesis